VVAYTAPELAAEARQALDQFWFLTSIAETAHGEDDYSARLQIQPGVFVQVFLGSYSRSLYIALIKDGQRIFGLDCIADEWHLHPRANPAVHQTLADGLGPRPLMAFLSRVEDILINEGLS
jgi:hypothetical protein